MAKPSSILCQLSATPPPKFGWHNIWIAPSMILSTQVPMPNKMGKNVGGYMCLRLEVKYTKEFQTQSDIDWLQWIGVLCPCKINVCCLFVSTHWWKYFPVSDIFFLLYTCLEFDNQGTIKLAHWIDKKCWCSCSPDMQKRTTHVTKGREIFLTIEEIFLHKSTEKAVFNKSKINFVHNIMK